jgi:hypothetical protein
MQDGLLVHHYGLVVSALKIEDAGVFMTRETKKGGFCKTASHQKFPQNM